MRSIVLVKLGDKARPALVMTRTVAIPYLNQVTVAPVTSTVRGIGSEVRLGPPNGLDHECVASCDTIVSVPAELMGETVGFLLDSQEPELAQAISHAFDLGGRS
ncbi:MAG: type II toxin-antitoxin system PemK/MazF family toxin [Bifidobacteriaceae bacterium]|jgi:mRNA interferase MazF|nr:type II toxin-antitoxin system PemK/MazF family toxin [Bifidobacteriaceae bacterium]